MKEIDFSTPATQWSMTSIFPDLRSSMMVKLEGHITKRVISSISYVKKNY